MGKQLPKGLLNEVAEQTGKSRTELKYRVLFAERFPQEHEVVNAIDHFGSWYRIANEALSPQRELIPVPDELPALPAGTFRVVGSRKNSNSQRPMTDVAWAMPLAVGGTEVAAPGSRDFQRQRVREAVGEGIEMSDATYQRAKAVIDAAEASTVRLQTLTQSLTRVMSPSGRAVLQQQKAPR